MPLLTTSGSHRRSLVCRIAFATAIAVVVHTPALMAQSFTPAPEATVADAMGRRVRATPNGNGELADEIRFALLPLPEQLRAGATVMHMDSTHHPVVVRQGSNGLVCMRVMPGEATWDARCYEEKIARLVFHAGELVMSGLTIDSLGPRIQAEVRAGKLALPARPAAAYRALGPEKAYDPETGAVATRMVIWQSLHVPFATAEEMGLPDESTLTEDQRARMAYVVSSGTWWSHVRYAAQRHAPSREASAHGG